MRPGSLQSTVLECVKSSGELTIKKLREVLCMEGEKNAYARLSNACQDLDAAGYFERTAPATYAYVGGKKDLDYTGAQRRMSRVIRIRTKRAEPFTARKLAELSGCSLEWAQKYIRYLSDRGYLQRVGRISAGCTKATTHLADESKLNGEWPAMRRTKKTTALDDAAPRIRGALYSLAGNLRGDREFLAAAAETLRQIAAGIDEILDPDRRAGTCKDVAR